jgi:hypothetical protein
MVARAPAQYLTQLIRAAAAGKTCDVDAQRIAPLIGLGPGLTPSGDDYLGGILLALSLTGETTLCHRLWRALQPLFAERTTDISRAHLAAAAEGFGNAALHDLLTAIIAGRADALSGAIQNATAVGHTSGWDAVAGAVGVLRIA